LTKQRLKADARKSSSKALAEEAQPLRRETHDTHALPASLAIGFWTLQLCHTGIARSILLNKYTCRLPDMMHPPKYGAD
jgi:hypothetical protein